ncbi:vitamin K epoxide reductase family protein [uncultured Thermanaerothrix sp.]|uniref:vitamin K epoxide reductase family protein n=1 Tax=uncultured Thermanaerothrix sp. TaxID=1195149 RepID=UPI00261EB83A|nr:vitamin K epoxide reductase family protein [uncultured Thermanaerothrix sp.]
MKRLRLSILILGLIGLIDSLYLTWIKISHTEALCLPGFGNCDIVNNSRYSEIMGIPIALLGALAYLTILGLLFVEQRMPHWQENTSLILFGVTLAGTGYSAYLTYLEFAIIKAICPFCLLSAIVMGLLFVIAIVRLAKA